MQFAPVRAWSCSDGLGGRRRSSRGELYCSAWWRSIRSALRRQRTRQFASSRFFFIRCFILHFCLSESFFFLFCKTQNALNNGIGFIKTFVVVNGSSVAVCKCLLLMVRSRFLFLLCICLPWQRFCYFLNLSGICHLDAATLGWLIFMRQKRDFQKFETYFNI